MTRTAAIIFILNFFKCSSVEISSFRPGALAVDLGGQRAPQQAGVVLLPVDQPHFRSRCGGGRCLVLASGLLNPASTASSASSGARLHHSAPASSVLRTGALSAAFPVAITAALEMLCYPYALPDKST